MHSYIWKKVFSQEDINLAKTTSWLANKYTTSHFEGYTHILYQQKIPKIFNSVVKKADLQPKHNNHVNSVE